MRSFASDAEQEAWAKQRTHAEELAERPDGSYVELNSASRTGRPTASILVREDNPDRPGDPRRWRAVEQNSAWMTWPEFLAKGTVRPLYSREELLEAVRVAQQQHNNRRLVPPNTRRGRNAAGDAGRTDRLGMGAELPPGPGSAAAGQVVRPSRSR